MKIQEKGPRTIIYKAEQLNYLIPRVYITVIKKHVFNNFNKIQGNAYDMIDGGQEKGCATV